MGRFLNKLGSSSWFYYWLGMFYTGWSLDGTCGWNISFVPWISGRRTAYDRSRLQLFLYDCKIGWVVDMCSVGTAFGYFFTCAGAYILLKKYGDDTDTNRIHPAVALGGCIISVMILLLLIVPGSPAFMAPQSFAALIVWVLMGVTFYFVSKKNFAKISKREMDYLILGNVQVVRGMRKGKDQGSVVQGNVVQPKI